MEKFDSSKTLLKMAGGEMHRPTQHTTLSPVIVRHNDKIWSQILRKMF